MPEKPHPLWRYVTGPNASMAHTLDTSSMFCSVWKEDENKRPHRGANKWNASAVVFCESLRRPVTLTTVARTCGEAKRTAEQLGRMTL